MATKKRTKVPNKQTAREKEAARLAQAARQATAGKMTGDGKNQAEVGKPVQLPGAA